MSNGRIPLESHPLNTQMNLHWGMNKANLSIVQNALATKTFWDNLSFMFVNPTDWLISLKMYPFEVTKFIGTENHRAIVLGTSVIEKSDGFYNLNAVNKPIEIAGFSVHGIFNNFLDYAPYTRLQLYLPPLAVIRSRLSRADIS